ncbi:N2-acetyl-L-aminoadipate kinase /N-acetylglutamate kinase [Haloarcula vallismortis]|uniref:Putative [LysW]-aminoadipate/[LysW]-glutamate kinase n=2 Tax=Haloarcula vallismortis TaxID=28442 RepID=M0J5U8_HALVA|nr:acetylglutamate/acetylaminoadipate kinase [Haloarcula vallismortis]EMA03733.1 acetylglutamate/acetylaminoadipate kinase [Haloarcula vallismortis ATCC 29715]SDW33167.1 N2-acetyl-L-aminoadipate kinase /N-acetylglutamate kinase [Haloarcula vallismortis]
MTVVIKVGGARAVDPAGALADVASLVADGEQVVVVHGGSTKVDETLERLGVEPEYVETPSGVVGRFTDETTMEVFEMAFGHLNTQLVAGLQSEGVDAVGLTGVDGKLLYGPRKSAVRVVEDGKKKIRRGDHSGTIKQVNGDLLETLLSDGYTPVAAPPMAGDDDGDVIPVNTDADRSAAAIAGELDATLVLLTDVAGVYADPEDPATLIEAVETATDWEALEDAAEGFMSRKIMAVEEALSGGAPEAVVADANADAPIRSALDGGGTHVHASALEQDTDQTATEEQ